MAKPTRLYWDSCVWIAIIAHETAIPLKGGYFENRYSICNTVLSEAKNGKIEIFTSCFALAEVCKISNINEYENLSDFFNRDYIIAIPVDFEIGGMAQALQLKDDLNLRPQDAVHVASAIRAGVDQMNTFDADILKLNGKLLSSDKSPLQICKPGN